MIIWLNGPFGAGKTTLAQTLRKLRSDLLLFDPEEIGVIVKTIVPPAPSGGYQDLPLWRGMTAAALAEIRKHYSQDIIVPMTLVRFDYLDELLGGPVRRGECILHVFLTVDKRGLRERIERQTMSSDHTRNEQIREWRLAQADRCLSARDVMPNGTRFLGPGLHTPEKPSRHSLGMASCDAALTSGASGAAPNAELASHPCPFRTSHPPVNSSLNSSESEADDNLTRYCSYTDIDPPEHRQPSW